MICCVSLLDRLALSNLIAVVKLKTAAGYIPGFASGNAKTRGGTQPPVTSKALFEVAKRWGVKRTRFALDLCFDDLFTQNTWMYTQRRLLPLGLITYGSSPYDSWAPDGSSQASVPGCSNGEVRQRTCLCVFASLFFAIRQVYS